MTDSATTGFGDEELLAQLGWVRRLARELVHEPSAVDDVTQEVARLALEKRATFRGDARGLRAWLGAIARRVAIDRHRAERARSNREAESFHARHEEPPDAIVERSTRARHLADLVHALPEPYRATVLHRYFDEASMAEVARRTQVDEATARKRLQRARDMLRAQLEHGDGRAWLAAIAGVGLDRVDLVPVTTGVGATTVVAAGVGVMTAKLVAAAVVCAALAAWFVTRPAGDAVDPGLARTPVVAARDVELADAKTAAAVETPPQSDPARAPVAASAPAPVAAPHDGPLLRVRVVDADRRPVTSGMLDVWRDRRRLQPFSSTRTHALLEIAGEVTDILLPIGTQSAEVSASTSGLLASAPTGVARIGAHETRDLTLEVGGALKAPSLSGRVLVDGVQRAPKGLSISAATHGAVLRGRVNVLDGTWAVDALPEKPLRWTVASDETVVESIELKPPDGATGALDLELTTGPTLVVTLLDRASGRPLAGARFRLQTNHRAHGDVHASTQRLLSTDEHGVCRTRGIPRAGSFQILPDLDPVTRDLVYNDGGEPMPYSSDGEAWYSRLLGASDPAELAVELRVDLPQAGASAFGFLTPELLAAVQEKRAYVVCTEVTEAVPRGGDPFRAPVDAAGRWSLERHWPSRHLVWVMDAKTGAKRTEKTELVLERPGEHGPIELAPVATGADPIEIAIRGVPPGARASIVIQEDGEKPRSESPELRDGAGVHRFTLAKPARVTVSCRIVRDNDPQWQERHQRLQVDPAGGRRFEVDFASGAPHRVVFAPTGEPLPASTKVAFVRWWTTDGFSNDVVQVTTGASGTVDDVYLGPGRWLWSCVVWGSNATAVGVVDVGDMASEIRLAPRIVKRPRADFPNGIVWEEADGVDLTPIAVKRRTHRFDAEGDVLLRDDARFSRVP